MQRLVWMVAACLAALFPTSGCQPTTQKNQAIAPPVLQPPVAQTTTTDRAKQITDNQLPETEAAFSEEIPWHPSGSWSKRRLIVLGAAGPIVVDLSASVGRHDLSDATKQVFARIADQLLPPPETTGSSSPTPVTWDQLLDLPLVRSGWLGNLLASNEQREQLISLYDTQRDDIVSVAELPAFLSRGLTRAQPLQIADMGQQPNQTANASPWGKADLNGDASLDAHEREELATSILRQDVNADGIVARAELLDSSMTLQTASRNGSTLLRTTTLIAFDESSNDASAVELTKTRRKLAVEVLRHYTFLAELSREQWPGWSDATWRAVDVNSDLRINANELLQLVAITPHVELYVRLPPAVAQDVPVNEKHLDDPSRTGDGLEVKAIALDPAFRWQANARGGVLTGSDCSIQVEVSDSFSDFGKRQLREQLSQALKKPQVKAFFTRQFQLQENAFELLDADADEALNDAEFENAWSWLTSRQSARLSGKWMLSAEPWFQLADLDGDARVSEKELRELAKLAAKLDADQDDLVTPNEMPLVARFEFERTDQRLGSPLTPNRPNPVSDVDLDWFSAMDTNRDGFISTREFLGELSVFSASDSNRDGFLDRSEAFSDKSGFAGQRIGL